MFPFLRDLDLLGSFCLSVTATQGQLFKDMVSLLRVKATFPRRYDNRGTGKDVV